MKNLKLLIQKLLLQLQILKIQLVIALFKEKRTVPNLDKPNKIILHHGGGWLNFAGVNAWHKIRWGYKSSLGYYCGYTIFIERNGKIIQARRDNEEGAHTKGFNNMTIGIGLMGNGVEHDFTREQYGALISLVEQKRKQYNIPLSGVHGHNAYSNTICPSPPLEKWLLNYKKVD